MDAVWLAKLNHHATTVQIVSEKVLRISSQPNFDEQRAQAALQLVRDGHSVFEVFSDEARDAELPSSYYRAAAEVDDAWTNIVKLLLTRLLEFQITPTKTNAPQHNDILPAEPAPDLSGGYDVMLDTEPDV
ncbi:hypothetical protein LQT97_00470 [Brucella pseudogrignonensis]|uniref:hypothetical protein n=1 Tax=Brucella pseudogrignonensis TaxID=419475 RepID=UPI001E4876FF|nr:hypothetical protein [Brucella pseudogrignonensis]MCD4509697.1 hypothetical protein [Brucella pseudogrignonensis]